MDTKLIARLVELVRKTGDRVVVPDDTEAGKAVVIMDLDAYEELMGTASRELPVVATVEPPLQQMFEPEPIVAPAGGPELVEVAETDVVQQIRAIRKESETSSLPPPASRQEPQAASAPPVNLPVVESQDLTPSDNDAKIKREIGNWKTIGDVLPPTTPAAAGTPPGQASQPTNQPAVQSAPVVANQLEDEERFYLEPIE
ncbi:MAG: hypothetical protein U9Q03_02445 [Patescibacteria group bacterium]|nr:hypothetical protein [Patescibacteria group bacterium]